MTKLTEKNAMTPDELLQYLEDNGITPDLMRGEDVGTGYAGIGKCLAEYGASKLAEEQQELLNAATDWLNRTHEERLAADKALAEMYPCGPCRLVHSEGGGEGQGEHVERVWHFPRHGVYLKATASYYSFHGVDYWGDFTVVRPRTVETVVYE